MTEDTQSDTSSSNGSSSSDGGGSSSGSSSTSNAFVSHQARPPTSAASRHAPQVIPSLALLPRVPLVRITTPPKRRLTPAQTKVLFREFEVTHFPSTERRQELADQLGLPVRSVQIWFQNRRQKHKERQQEEERQQKLRRERQHVGGVVEEKERLNVRPPSPPLPPTPPNQLPTVAALTQHSEVIALDSEDSSSHARKRSRSEEPPQPTPEQVSTDRGAEHTSLRESETEQKNFTRLPPDLFSFVTGIDTRECGQDRAPVLTLVSPQSKRRHVVVGCSLDVLSNLTQQLPRP